jgi:hypothetical protein
MFQQASLQMRWCLECHRNPENFVRPPEHVYDPEWNPPPGWDPQRQGVELVKKLNIHSAQYLTNCSVCHR